MRVTTPATPLAPMQVEDAAPAPGWMRIDVVACGVCFADLKTARADGDASLPVTPGHEIAGTVAELGDGVPGWQVGDRVAVGWFGGSCGHCDFCRRGDVVHCPERKTTGVSYPGGWAESLLAPADAVARIPDGLDFHEAAPMGCAGVTTFNAIRHAHVPAGGRVAVFGLGGLGHLAVQFAAKMGYDVVVIARGSERASLARELGARDYIDSDAVAPGEALRESGGADLMLSTASSTAPLTELSTGLRPHGRLTLIGVDAGSVDLPAVQLVTQGHTVTGHLTGGAQDTEEAMRFAVLHGVRPIIERRPLEEANEALTRLEAGEVRFRIVLDTSPERTRAAD